MSPKTGSELIHVRDPIHGNIRLTPLELRVVETEAYQRLRTIKQLGFTDYAFPGASHSRFIHGLGAMELSGHMFDAIFPHESGILHPECRQRFRQLLRLAVLLHDVGHAPLSHTTETCMPPLSQLDLGEPHDDPTRRATHEDYSALLIIKSSLKEVIDHVFKELDISASDVAYLITGFFSDACHQKLIHQGVDYSPLMRQLVSGELDADRMDYLQRDSFYAGVSYGKFDEQWLLNNLTYYVDNSRAFLALSHRAIFAFEDFLLSRYHMFVSVYYHHTSINFDTMLARLIEEDPEALALPSDPEHYLCYDDISFWSLLRRSSSPWAQRIVRRNLYRRLIELNVSDDIPHLRLLEEAFTESGVDYFVSRDESVLSRYYGTESQTPLFIINKALGQATRVDEYSKLFERYAQPARLTRIYCRPDHVDRARTLIATILPRHHRQLKLPWVPN